jgi:phosphoribosylamine-glycine ligase
MLVAKGEIPELKWKNNLHYACVVLAAEGYPDAPVKNVMINGDPTEQTASSYFLHAATKAKMEKRAVIIEKLR